jgi:hypothetical protein
MCGNEPSWYTHHASYKPRCPTPAAAHDPTATARILRGPRRWPRLPHARPLRRAVAVVRTSTGTCRRSRACRFLDLRLTSTRPQRSSSKAMNGCERRPDCRSRSSEQWPGPSELGGWERAGVGRRIKRTQHAELLFRMGNGISLACCRPAFAIGRQRGLAKAESQRRFHRGPA